MKLKLLIAVIQINECIKTIDFSTEIIRAVFQSFNARHSHITYKILFPIWYPRFNEDERLETKCPLTFCAEIKHYVAEMIYHERGVYLT